MVVARVIEAKAFLIIILSDLKGLFMIEYLNLDSFKLVKEYQPIVLANASTMGVSGGQTE